MIFQNWYQTTFKALKDKEFQLFYVGLGCSFVGAWMRRTALGWVVFEITGSYELLGTVFALSLIPLFLLAPLAGSMADRMDKRVLISASRALAFLVSGSMGILLFFDMATVGGLFFLAFMSGIAFAFEVPTRQSFVVEIVGRDLLMNAIALNSALINLSRFIGPALAGLLMKYVGAAFVFWFDALSSLIVIYTMYRIRPTFKGPLPVKGGHLQRIIDGFSEAKKVLPVRNMLLLLAAVTCFFWSFDTLMPGIAQDELGYTETEFGVLMGMFGFGAVIGALFVAGRPAKKFPRFQVYSGILLFAVGLMGLCMFRNFLVLCAWITIAGLGAITFLSTANTIIQMSVEDHIRGRIMGLWSLVFGGCMPLGALVAGFVASKISPFMTIQIFVCAGLLCSFLTFNSMERKLHKVR